MHYLMNVFQFYIELLIGRKTSSKIPHKIYNDKNLNSF